MKFDRFERMAREAFEAIPGQYREGIDGLVVSQKTEAHPTLPDIYTLGYCDTESYPSEWSGPETVRSRIVLYYGSFQKLARLDPEFDWEAEIHETVEHEVRHHLEWLADEDQLGDVDYAMDESFKRGDGLEWDPWYWQHGEPVGDGAHVVEDQVYVELPFTARDFESVGSVRFRWRRREYEVERPEELGDLHFVLVTDGVDRPPPWLELVLVRRRSWWEDAKRLLGSSRPRVLESEGVARPVPPAGGSS
jgi:predicted Zn-dependent protease with MMP-like domain